MLRILFVTKSWPYPPRQGVELPVAELARRLSARHHVDMVGWGEKNARREEKAGRNVSGRVLHIPCNMPIFPSRLVCESLGVAATYSARGFDPGALKLVMQGAPYDWAWVSPIGGIGLLYACERQGMIVAKNTAIGINDEIAYAAWNPLVYMLRGRTAFEIKLLLNGLRLPLIAMYERRYCRKADLVCVQTGREQLRIRRLLGRHVAKPRVAVLPNGVPAPRKAGHDSQRRHCDVLYMTHFGGARWSESHWFLTRVWPRIVERRPEATLHLVGVPPREGDLPSGALDRNVRVRGFVEDLNTLCATMTLAVMPAPHSSGIVNRVRDALGAGLPLVACSGPASTVDGLVPGRDAVIADTPKAFADAVVELLDSPERRSALSRAASELSTRLPSWEMTAEKAEALLDRPADG